MINENFYKKINKTGKIGIVAGVTQIGPAHVSRLKGSQDSLGIFECDRAVAIAVADGVGSSPLSEEGSQYAVSMLQKLITENNVDELPIGEVRHYIVSQWQQKFHTMNDYATTLRFCIITNDNVLVGSIGDGKTFLSIDNNYLQYETEDAFLNCTDALSMYGAYDKLIVDRYVVKHSVSVAIMTDGVSNEVQVGKEESFLMYLTNIAGNDDMMDELTQWIEGLNSANGDDKTIGFLKLEG